MLPIALGAGILGLAGLGYYLYEEEQKKKPPTAKEIGASKNTTPPQVPPIQNQPGSPRLNPNPPAVGETPPRAVIVGETPGGNKVVAVVTVDPGTGIPAVSGQLSVEGPAMPQAHELFDYLKQNGTANTQELKRLTLAFQKAHNSTNPAKAVTGELVQDGLYGPMTSAALTVYTGQPIPPAGSMANTVPTSPSSPGTAALAASNLYAYLKLNGAKNDGKPERKAIIKQFQHAANTDPLYPGPASMNASTRIIKIKLVEDGLYGPKTSDALAAINFERIPPA